MTFPEDIDGKYFKFRVPESGQVPGHQVGLMHREHAPAFCSVRGEFVPRPRSGAIGGGPPPVPPRPGARGTPPPLPPRPFQFTWLNYVRGGVTHAELGRGVLTGKMSGCYIFTYAFMGRVDVAHVGTVDWETSAGSAAAKRTWVDFCEHGAASPIEGQAAIRPTQVKGASPSAYFSDEEKFAVATVGAGMPFVLCYTGAGGRMYSLLCYEAKPDLGPVPGEPDWIKVHAVREMTLQPWDSLKQLRSFRDIRVAEPAGRAGVIKGTDLGKPIRQPV